MFLKSSHENMFETIIIEHFKNYCFVNILSIMLKYIAVVASKIFSG